MQQQSFGARLLLVAILLVASFLATGCNSEPLGADLYTLNCASCHGAVGKGGSAIGLGNSAYLATHDDTTITRLTSDGVPNTVMRAFSKSKGGPLTDEQIAAIVQHLRSNR